MLRDDVEGWDEGGWDRGMGYMCIYVCVCVYIYIYTHIYIVMIDSPCMTETNKHCKAIILQLKKKD